MARANPGDWYRCFAWLPTRVEGRVIWLTHYERMENYFRPVQSYTRSLSVPPIVGNILATSGLDAQRRLQLDAIIMRYFVTRLISARFANDIEAEQLLLNEDNLVGFADAHAKTPAERAFIVTHLHDLAVEIAEQIRAIRVGKSTRMKPALRVVRPTDG